MSEKVNHPKHYNAGNIEVIEIIKDQGLLEGFCKGNAIKYILRSKYKESEIEDLSKAIWYLNYYSEYLEELREDVTDDES